MLDIPARPDDPASQITIKDHVQLGQLVRDWATRPETRPQSVADLRTALTGIAEVSADVTSIEFCQSTASHMVLQLPARDFVEEQAEMLQDPDFSRDYPIPQFYADHYRPGLCPILTPLDTFHARLGDCTFAHCS